MVSCGRCARRPLLCTTGSTGMKISGNLATSLSRVKTVRKDWKMLKMLNFNCFFLAFTKKKLERDQTIRCSLTHKTTACISATAGPTRDAPCKAQMVHWAAASRPTKAEGINACSAAFPRK